MVTIGVDSHKRTHTFVAVDDVGKKLAERTWPRRPEGHLDALEWAERWPERRWAIEDCRHLTRRLESDLLAGGRGGAAGSDEADGWRAARGPGAGQVRPDRRARRWLGQRCGSPTSRWRVWTGRPES